MCVKQVTVLCSAACMCCRLLDEQFLCQGSDFDTRIGFLEWQHEKGGRKTEEV
jgi:hypothetical protein